MDSNLNQFAELSALAAYSKRSKKHLVPNNSKINKAHDFIKLVETEMKSNKLSSVDETIHYLCLHEKDKIKNMETVCTKTFYNYIHQRKVKKNWKTYIPKMQKGTSITKRPAYIEPREELGHWEDDLITGPRDGKNGAYLTLNERKTRFYYMLSISSKSSKKVFMQINKLNKFYGNQFKDIFKSITFDNGSGFSR